MTGTISLNYAAHVQHPVWGIVCTKRPSDDDYPDFGEVSHILVYEEAKYLDLVLKEFETVTFSHHYFAYQVQDFVMLSAGISQVLYRIKALCCQIL